MTEQSSPNGSLSPVGSIIRKFHRRIQFGHSASLSPLERLHYKVKRRFHLLNFISPYSVPEEFITLGAIGELDRACEAFICRMHGLQAIERLKGLK